MSTTTVPESGFSPAAAASEAGVPVTVGASAGRLRGFLVQPLRRGAAPPLSLPRRARHSLARVSFVVMVLLPTTVAAVYYFAVAADQYVTEFRFTLSSVDPPRLDPLSLLAGNATQSSVTLESQILVQYIGSRSIVDEIDRSLDLRRLFTSPQADWLARLASAAPIEQLVHYWRGQVDPFYEPATGTVTVRARAFTPADTLRLSEAIVSACERLVNDLAQRAQRCAAASGSGSRACGRAAYRGPRRGPRLPRSRGSDRSDTYGGS